MTIGCNIWMICLKLNRFFYGLSRISHLSEIAWILRSSVLVVINNFLLIDATERSKISSDQKRFFIALSLYPLSFFANTPFKTRQFPLHLCCMWKSVCQFYKETAIISWKILSLPCTLAYTLHFLNFITILEKHAEFSALNFQS